MNQIADLNSKEQEGIKKLLAIDPSSLNYAQILYLRARRSYLSNEQKFKYCGILYFLRPNLYNELNATFRFLPKFAKEIIFGVIVTLVVLWITKLSGWLP